MLSAAGMAVIYPKFQISERSFPFLQQSTSRHVAVKQSSFNVWLKNQNSRSRGLKVAIGPGQGRERRGKFLRGKMKRPGRTFSADGNN